MTLSHSPNIVRDGLVLYLDAANKKSFRGEPTTNLISSSGIDVSVFSSYPLITASRVPEELAESGFALEMTIDDSAVNGSARISFGTADNIPTSGFVFISVYAKFSGGTLANIRPRLYTGLAWDVLDPLDGGSIYLTNEYRRFGAYLELGTNSGGPNPAFSMTYGNSNRQAGQKTRWHSPQVELKEYATPFVIGTRGSTVATGGGWADLSGNSNHGVIEGDTSYDASNSGAITFDGSGDFISFPSEPDLNGKSFSCICWFKTTDTDMRLVQNCNTGSYGAKNGFQISVTSSSFGNTGITDSFGNYVSFGSVSATPYTNGSWHFLCLVFETATGEGKLYLDGNLERSEVDAGLIGADMNGVGLLVGRANSGAQNLNGSISKVAMYNKALTAQEIQKNFNALRGRYGI